MDDRDSPAQRDPQGTWAAPDQAPQQTPAPQQAPPGWGHAGAGGQGWNPPPGPGYGPPGPGYGPPPGPGYGPPQPQTEGLAIGALICAVANYFLWIFIPAIVSLILAAQASSRIKRSGGTLGGQGLVTASRIISVISLALNVLAAVVIVVLIVQGVRAAEQERQELQESGAPAGEVAAGDTSAGETTNAHDLQPGDCVVGSFDGLVNDVPVVPCDQPHDGEVYVNFDLPNPPDEPFPGDETVSAAAQDGCLAEFEPYVGVPLEESQFDLRFLNPSQESWPRGDRNVTCMIAPLGDGEPLVGSARGSER
jgi:uncharacterized membrane protein